MPKLIERRTCGRAIAVFILILALPSPGKTEVYLSFFIGPSLSLKQDIKARTFNDQGTIIKKELVSSDSVFRFKTGTKITYFFHRNIGVESEFFYSQSISQVDLSGTRFSGQAPI